MVYVVGEYSMVYVVGEYNMNISIATGGPWMSKPILGTKCKEDYQLSRSFCQC